LGITASRGDDKSKALLLQLDNATSAYRPEEDSYKLFSDSLLASPAVYTRSSDGYALDINSVQDLSRPVPLCLRTSEHGAVTLTFSNVENFAANSLLYLHDLKLNRSINLRQQSEYSFIKDDDALYLEDRFLLSATAATTEIEQPESFTQPVIRQTPDGNIQILSGNNTPLRSIQITDAQGRILATEANAAAPYIYKVAAPGIYIVRISGESGAAVKKLIIK
jgi:hypothetical protein